MTQIIQRINKIQIIIQTIAIIPALDTRETTTTAEGTLTMLRMTTQRSHQSTHKQGAVFQDPGYPEKP